MAEFCLDCWNKLNGTQLTEYDVVLSGEDDMDLCEGCGQWKQVVIRTREGGSFFRWFHFFTG